MDKLFISERIFVNDEFIDGAIVVSKDGKISKILRDPNEILFWQLAHNTEAIFDFSKYVLMPGLIDSHVHINEPGRTAWEGFATATRAAAFGGFTSIIDMPLNSIPPTTTVKNLKVKQNAATGKIYVDVGFWGGIIPGNQDELKPLLNEGVVGFKCFLCPSGVPEFPHVERNDLELAFEKLANTNGLIAFHAEICHNSDKSDVTDSDKSSKYETYLKTRPSTFELNAIELVTELTIKYDSVRTHIVHLSAAEAIPIIQKCRKIAGNRLTVETCHHYLTLASEDIIDYHVEFKCCPPIRERANQQLLWQAILKNDINLVVSDHSPSTPDVKLLASGEKDYGDFLKAWGGISSVQFGLSLFWSHCQKYGLDVKDMQRLMCREPAKLCGLAKQKGQIEEGFDADFCVWNPDAELIITPDIVQFQNKANPYMGRKLNGRVRATIVRGNIVYLENEALINQPIGKLLKSQISV